MSFPTDFSIAKAVGRGGRAYHIADRLGARDRELRRITRRLLAMERLGFVRRSERYSVPNSYFWELTEKGTFWVSAETGHD